MSSHPPAQPAIVGVAFAIGLGGGGSLAWNGGRAEPVREPPRVEPRRPGASVASSTPSNLRPTPSLPAEVTACQHIASLRSSLRRVRSDPQAFSEETVTLLRLNSDLQADAAKLFAAGLADAADAVESAAPRIDQILAAQAQGMGPQVVQEELAAARRARLQFPANSCGGSR